MNFSGLRIIARIGIILMIGGGLFSLTAIPLTLFLKRFAKRGRGAEQFPSESEYASRSFTRNSAYKIAVGIGYAGLLCAFLGFFLLILPFIAAFLLLVVLGYLANREPNPETDKQSE